MLWRVAGKHPDEIIGQNVGKTNVGVSGPPGDMGEMDDIVAAQDRIVRREGFGVVDIGGPEDLVGKDSCSQRVLRQDTHLKGRSR